MAFRNKLIIITLLTLNCHFVNAQTSNDDLPNLSKSIYYVLANGCRKNTNVKYLIASTWGLMLESEIQNKISLINSCNKEAAYKLLNALYKTQPDLFKENLHALGLSVQECQECENAILTIKKKELNKVKAEEISIFDKWKKEGVPDDVVPNVNASLKYSGIAKTASFLESLEKNYKTTYHLKIRIESNGSICSIYTDEEELKDSMFLFNLFSFDDLSVEHPAFYDFTNIDKKIAMSSTENISILESRKSLTHDEPWDAPEYQTRDFDGFTLTVKYNLSKKTIKLVRYEDDENWFDSFCNENNLNKTYFIDNDIKKYLSSKDLDGKIRIKCQVRKRKVVVKHDGKLLAEQEIKPKLIVVNASTK